MRCQTQSELTAEKRFRSREERNIELKEVNTTLYYSRSNPISVLAESRIYRNDFQNWIIV
jgi:hypothetical protein